MRFLGFFAIALVVLGLGVGASLRRRWGPLRGVIPWLVALGPIALHTVVVTARGVAAGVAALPQGGYAVFTVVLLVAAGVAAARTMRRRSLWAAGVPIGAALLHGVATSALGAAFAAAGAAPPDLGGALAIGLALATSAAWLVWVPEARRPGPRFGWLRRFGRVRS